MTIEILTPISQLLRHQQELPESDRHSSVMLRFASPVPMSLTADFYRIHLTPEMKADGRSETGFYRPEVFQPQAMRKSKPCSKCRQPMAKVLISSWKCQNARCNNRGLTVVSGPNRGVIAVDVPDDGIVAREQIDAVTKNKDGTERKLMLASGVPMKCEKVTIDRCILRLDRRYDELCLAAIYRAAGAICEQYGWVLL